MKMNFELGQFGNFQIFGLLRLFRLPPIETVCYKSEVSWLKR